MTALVVSLAAIAIALIVHDAFKRWLARERVDVVQLRSEIAELKTELVETQRQWAQRFAVLEDAQIALVKAVDKIEPGTAAKAKFNPLGRSYNARG